ncbi:hypothetical protein SDC9_107523 [bioreactor metagenome]|uniref:Apea-like HEPN domain-containing protein n=1 Tax=bioreactor metagenome TaxID=1076179 RepID=A0A645B7U1_9ZZZZ
MLSGELVYKQIKYHFTYENNELRMDAIESGGFSFFSHFANDHGLHLEEEYLLGECFSTGNKVVFVPKYDSFSASNDTMIVAIKHVIQFNRDIETIYAICIEAIELDYIYNVNRSISYSFSDGMSVENIGIHSQDETTINCGEIRVDSIAVQCIFKIIQRLRLGPVKEPIQLSSCIELVFTPTSDYKFIISLCYYIRGLLRFLCYRRNISISSVILYSDSTGIAHQCGDLIFGSGPQEAETQKVIKDRYIPFDYLHPHISEILQDIIDGQLYLAHLPATAAQGKEITNASFLMTAAAFEAEFSRLYPDGLPSSESRIRAQTAAEASIQNLIETTQGKEKDIYKFLKKMIRTDATKEKVALAARDYGDVADIFGKHLFALNHREFEYSTIGQRVFDQRNIFAHGKRSDFIPGAFLDVMYLEYLIYGMQLSKYGIEKLNIQKAINKLFGKNLAL